MVLITKQKRSEFDAGAVPRKNFIQRLKRDARKYQALKIAEQVMFSFTTDVYNPFNTSLTRSAIEILIEHGLAFCVLTKGGTRALADIDLYRPDRDAFASTLTSLDDGFSRKWEPMAALPADWLAALRAFHERGIFTWVSLEPTLDIEHSLAVVEATHQFVDLYKVGRANYLKELTKTLDWKTYTLRMVDALNRLGKKYYINAICSPTCPLGISTPFECHSITDVGRPANCKHAQLIAVSSQHYRCGSCSAMLAVVEVASIEKMLRHNTARLLARLDTVRDDLRELDEGIRELRARVDAALKD